MTITEVTSFLSREKSTLWTVESLKIPRAEGTFEHVFFLDNALGWVASKSALFKTSNGGQSWIRVRVKIQPRAEITDINFVSASRGWLTMEKRMPDSDYRENRFWVFQTQDGGQSWKLSYEDKAASVSQVSFVDEKNGWLTGIRYIGISPLRFKHLLLHTLDQGQHWLDVSEGLNHLAQQSQDSVNDRITKIVSTDQTTATVLTVRGRVFQTIDGGTLWRELENISDEPPQMCICDFGIKVDGRLWIAGGAYSDEGIASMILSEKTKGSWTRFRLGGVYFADVLFIGKDELLASGSRPIDESGRDLSQKEGVILYSYDGGHAWSIIYRNDQIKSINKLAAVDPRHVVAVGEQSIVRLRSAAGKGPLTGN